MKRIATLLVLLYAVITVSAQKKNDPIIMTIGDKKVTKSEFQYIWNKNNNESSLEKQSLDEYVNLFVNFKLKVAEAESQGLDKKKSFIDELEGYRRQLVVSYLTDKETEEKIAKQTFDRMREYVEISHILIRVGTLASPEDTLKAWNKAMDVYQKAVSNQADFADLASTYSDDATKSQGGYIGFVTAIRFFYTFENGIYGTPVGTLSKPYRTEYGYHIIKVHSRRPAIGRYRAAHIMVKVKDTDSPEIQQAAKNKITKAYESLKNGENFSEVARRLSDDANSAMNGGDMGMLFCGSLPIQFEEAVFKQQKDTYSEPIKTEFGWHIVKSIDIEPYSSMETIRDEIDNIINKDERVEEPRNVLVEKLRKAYGSSIDKSALDDIILQYDNLRLKKDSSGVLKLLNSGRRLFTIGESTFAIKDFLVYLSAKPTLANAINRAFDSFIKDKVIAYEDARLETKYPEFGHLMQEYRDGILLFEISSKEVWDKASADEAGLKAYFTAHKADYDWNKPRFKGYLVECSTKEIAAKAQKRIRELAADSVATVLDREFNTGNSVSLITEYGVFEEGSNTTVDRLAFNKTETAVQTNLPEAFLEGRMLKNGPEELADVMGLVISDYQNKLEDEWLKRLQKKYKISIDKAVVKSVNNN